MTQRNVSPTEPALYPHSGKLKPKAQALAADPELIEHLYSLLSATDIGALYDLSNQTVRQILRFYGVGIRNRGVHPAYRMTVEAVQLRAQVAEKMGTRASKRGRRDLLRSVWWRMAPGCPHDCPESGGCLEAGACLLHERINDDNAVNHSHKSGGVRV